MYVVCFLPKLPPQWDSVRIKVSSAGVFRSQVDISPILQILMTVMGKPADSLETVKEKHRADSL